MTISALDQRHIQDPFKYLKYLNVFLNNAPSEMFDWIMSPSLLILPYLFPVANYLLKVNNRNIRTRCEIYNKTPTE